jgi:hypothetical protein
MANPHGLIYSSPVYFDGKIYIQGVGDVIKAFALKLDPATNTMMLDETPVTQGTTVSGFPGEVQSVSANGNTNGIVWSAQVDNFNGPAILRAYDANNLSTPLYASNQAGARDTAGNGLHFTTPTIANGMVYLATQFEVDVYGLLRQSGGAPHSVAAPARAALTPGRGVLTAGAHDRESPKITISGPLRLVAPRITSAAATHAGPATTRFSRAAAASIVAPNPGRRAGGGAQPFVTLSGNEPTNLHDLAISALDGDNGLVSVPGLKKNRSGHLSWT